MYAIRRQRIKTKAGNITRSKGRQKFLPLETPCPKPTNETPDRTDWIQKIFNGFVSPSKANREYYKVVLEELWPIGHGIPGPIISQGKLREAIDRERKKTWDKDIPYKNYVDVFRRIRELQGEEGITGIAREGQNYQLVRLDLTSKREPRVKLSPDDWSMILKKYNHSCAVCGRKEPEVKFDQDHKVPRTREGSNSVDNWQPLCHECNNFKSTSCRACSLECSTCPWAYPEKYGPLRLNNENITLVRQISLDENRDPSELLNAIVEKYLKKRSS